MFKSFDWSKIFSYGYHVALLAGMVAIQQYAGPAAQVWLPLLQALGQVSPRPEGITLMNK